MLVHDWCKLSYPGHTTKKDQAELSKGNNRGYELTTVLAVDGSNGAPLAPLEVHFKTADGLLSTRQSEPANVHHLDQVLPTMNASHDWNLPCSALHVIDREADSVGHYRAWHAAGHHFLVRGQDHRVVTWEGRKLARRKVSEELLERGAFQHSGTVLSNAPIELLTAKQLAQCYYWRWRIESYFKLLTSHGQQLEHWRQETGAAIFRRLLVATMACVTVWQLLADTSPAAIELKDVLIRLSGRQMKRTVPYTAPALLDGLWSLLSVLEYLETHELSDLKKLVESVSFPVPIRKTG